MRAAVASEAATGRDFGQGRALGGRGGGYGADYGARPLTDDEFYSRVNRW